MESRNPVFARTDAFRKSGYATFEPSTPSAGQLEDLYASPSATAAQTGRMTLDDVVVRTATLFTILVVAAGATWVLAPANRTLWLGGMLVGLALALVISFSKTVRPGLIMAYAAVEGVFLGAISSLFNLIYPGIVFQAVLATMAAFAAMLGAYKIGLIRATPRFTKILVIATIGYGVFLLVNLVVALAFGGAGIYGLTPLGILVSLFGVGLASLNLVLDFDYIERGLRNNLPRQYSWLAGFGLVVTLVWLYIEFLRLLAILRGNN